MLKWLLHVNTKMLLNEVVSITSNNDTTHQLVDHRVSELVNKKN